MVKKVSKTKFVRQDVHPDVENRIEDFTDPEKLANAKARVLDYEEIAKRFSEESDLPEEIDDIIIPDTPEENVTSQSSEETLDDDELLRELETPSDTKPVSPPVAADDEDDFASFFGGSDSDLPPSQTTWDEDDIDTDLLDDGSSPFAEYGLDDENDEGMDDSEDDGVFGIPSTSSVPTPYGDKADVSRTPRRPIEEDIITDQPEWMMDDEDDDIPDINDISSDENLSDEGHMFDDFEPADEEEPVKKHEASKEALNDLLELGDESAPEEGEVVAEETKIIEEPEGKKRFGFLRRKKRRDDGEVTVTEVQVEETEDSATIVSETFTEGDEPVEELAPKKKKKGVLGLVSALAIIAALGVGGYYVADQMGYIPSSTPVVSRVVDNNDNSSMPSPNITIGDESDEGSSDPAITQDPIDVDNVEDVPVIVPEDVTIDTPVDINVPDEPAVVDVTEGEAVIDMPDDILSPEGNDSDPASPETTSDVRDAFQDLYGVGITDPEEETAKLDAAQALAKVNQLNELLEEQKRALDSALNRVQTLEAVMAERDASLADLQEDTAEATTSANEAKDMAMAQNNVLTQVVGIQDKMQIAEDLIVDLSQRTALLESDDSQEQQIRQLNDRITELTRDVGLIARTVLTNGQNLAQQQAAEAAAERAYQEAQNAVDAEAQATMDRQTQPAPAGSSGVYDNEQRLMTTPTLQDGVDIPADVKVGDELPVYGKVIDITPMEDGSKLVTMENSSKIIPRAEN